jgi:hypothetical protein
VTDHVEADDVVAATEAAGAAAAGPEAAGPEAAVAAAAATEAAHGVAAGPEAAVEAAAEATDADAADAAAEHEGAADEAADAAEPAPVFKVMELINVVFSLPSPSPVVQLRESEPPFRVLDFPIGLPEAQSIALALDHEKAARPSAHELLSAVIVATGSDVVAVRFTAERAGTIIAELDLMTPRGHQVIDCRPTDGIAVALRQAVPAPILCDETLLID